MRGREFIKLVGGGPTLLSVAARAQQPATPIIGGLLMIPADDPEAKVRDDAFLHRARNQSFRRRTKRRLDCGTKSHYWGSS